jgi:hypothetical protein
METPELNNVLREQLTQQHLAQLRLVNRQLFDVEGLSFKNASEWKRILEANQQDVLQQLQSPMTDELPFGSGQHSLGIEELRRYGYLFSDALKAWNKVRLTTAEIMGRV